MLIIFKIFKSMEETPKEEQTPQSEPKKEGGSDNTIAVLSYLGILFLVPMLASKDNEFAQYHAKQGLTLFIAEIVTWVVFIIPFIGWVVGGIAWVTWIVLSIIGIVNVLGNKKKPLPLLGGLAEKFKI